MSGIRKPAVILADSMEEYMATPDPYKEPPKSKLNIEHLDGPGGGGVELDEVTVSLGRGAFGISELAVDDEGALKLARGDGRVRFGALDQRGVAGHQHHTCQGYHRKM